MQPRDPMKPRRCQHSQVLQIALTPSAVARCKIEERRRTFLETAAQFRCHVDRPSGAPHESCFNEVMAENMAAERLAPGKFGQAGMFCKGAHADDGVVSPVIAFRAVPPSDSGGDYRAIKPASELLHPCE